MIFPLLKRFHVEFLVQKIKICETRLLNLDTLIILFYKGYVTSTEKENIFK